VIDPIRGSAAVQGAWASRPHRSNPVGGTPTLLEALVPAAILQVSGTAPASGAVGRAPASDLSQPRGSAANSSSSLLSAFSPRGMQSLFHRGQHFRIFPGPRVRPSRSVGVPPTSRPPRNADAPVGPPISYPRPVESSVYSTRVLTPARPVLGAKRLPISYLPSSNSCALLTPIS
jgi:hypothetical protein